MTTARIRVLHVVHGAPGGIGQVEKLLGAVWARQETFEVTTLRRGRLGRLRWILAIFTTFFAQRPDAVILNHINFAPLAISFRLLRPAMRVVILAYGREIQSRPARLQRRGLHLADHVWSISEYTARQVMAAFGLRRDKITVVPLALLPERAHALGCPTGGQGEGPQLLTVSRLWIRQGEGKGIDHLIEAMAGIDADVKLVVIGDGDDRARLEHLAATAGVSDRVTFLGQTDDQTLVDRYLHCRLFALPSLLEGFGLVFLEAMAAGKPVVAARAGAVPELVRDGETGLLVAYGDRQALSRAIQSLITQPAYASELGRAGRQVADAEFGFNRFEAQVTALLTELFATPVAGKASAYSSPLAGEGRGGG